MAKNQKYKKFKNCQYMQNRIEADKTSKLETLYYKLKSFSYKYKVVESKTSGRSWRSFKIEIAESVWRF